MRRKADRPNGRGLTYRERWEHLRAWLDDPLNWNTGPIAVFGAQQGIRDQMDRLDETRVVKARPVRKRAKRRRTK
jgi:hypothetical protein